MTCVRLTIRAMILLDTHACDETGCYTLLVLYSTTRRAVSLLMLNRQFTSLTVLLLRLCCAGFGQAARQRPAGSTRLRRRRQSCRVDVASHAAGLGLNTRLRRPGRARQVCSALRNGRSLNATEYNNL